MFDSIGTYTRQFTPVDGGYLYYPSRKGGAKLVTTDEFEGLVEAHRRRTNPWKIAIAAMVAILIWAILSNETAIPEWGENVFRALIVAAVCGWIIWAVYAPRRLVKDRPEVVPARPLSERQRQARAVINWPFVLFCLIASGAVFAAKLLSPESKAEWWAWTVGSGLLFLAYLRIAFLKAKDQQR